MSRLAREDVAGETAEIATLVELTLGGDPAAFEQILSAFLAAGLRLDPSHIPSPLIGRPAPRFELTQLHEPNQTFTPEDLLGNVWLLNVWASWCVSCRVEHTVLAGLSRARLVPIYGLAYKDRRESSLAFLQSFGDPYVLSLEDPDGRVGIDYGVYGVPETFRLSAIAGCRSIPFGHHHDGGERGHLPRPARRAGVGAAR
jgi:cytochrome c biogenesis protein CcmG/thiol:disulfide interchange protein DsbE